MSTVVPRAVVAHRIRPGELAALDALAAVLLTLVCWYAASEPAPAGGLTEPVWLSALVGLLLGGPVAVRRRYPLTAFGLALTGSVVALGTGMIPAYAAMSVATALSFTLYTVGVQVSRGRSVGAVVVGVAATMIALVASTVAGGGVDSPQNVAEIGFIASVPAVAWLIGLTVRERRAYAAQAAEQVTLQAVGEERLRIARELHDIVAHSMSLIAVKAAVANHVAVDRPQEAREALEVIETTSRRALLDIRRTLGLLREEVSYAPTPGLADLPRLAEQVAAVGVDVDLTVEGVDDVAGGEDLPDGVGLSVFRIVQESLTNVATHAAPARCHVRVRVGSGTVHIDVTDDGRRPRIPGPAGGGPALGRGPAGGGQGHGLVGMRERVNVYGGDFTAGPLPGGGFRVAATLPYAEVP